MTQSDRRTGSTLAQGALITAVHRLEAVAFGRDGIATDDDPWAVMLHRLANVVHAWTGSERQRIAVAEDPRTPAYLLSRMARDPSDAVRRAVAGHACALQRRD